MASGSGVERGGAARRRGCRGRPRGRRAPARRARLVPQAPAPMTAARRTRGVPPSHSHCSSTHGQMRSVTAAASWRLGSCTCGKVSGAPARMRTLCGRMRQPLRTASEPMIATGIDGRAGLERQAPDAALRPPQRPGPRARALGEDQHAVAALEDRARGGHRLLVGGAAIDRVGAQRGEQPRGRPVDEGLLLRHEVDRPRAIMRDDEGIQERAVVGGDDERALGRDVLAPDAAQAEVQVAERLQHRPQPASRRAG